MPVLAYHITWTTCGTWLPGDERGWMDDLRSGVQPPDPRREDLALRCMAEDDVVLSDPQQLIVEETIRRHCDLRGWHIHALNVRSNHIHIVVTAGREPSSRMCVTS